MSYQALYRKFRPKSFDGIIGQNHIVRTLKNQIETGRVSHAYLFCGTRGTGKTSTAKIFARAINCLNIENGEPCGHCELCEAMAEGRSMNVIEIDAASNNGVDNIREIREEVKYPPTEGKFKVYIIDEVHMLSAGAFNALLKTLEEPPEHVIFILATTDPQKVPATIHSRCQRFDFRRISSEEIVNTLKKYLLEENVLAEDKALHYIAQLSDGSMRDSLSILDQCIAFYFNEEITFNKVLDIVGSVDNDVFFKMTDAVATKNAAVAMDIVDEIIMQGRDTGQFVTELIVHLRNLLIAASVKDPSAVLDISNENINKLNEQIKIISHQELIYLIGVFSQLSGQLKYAGNERILLEVALIKLCSPSADESYDSLAARISSLERDIKSGSITIKTENVLPTAIKEEKPKPKPKPKAMPNDIQEVKDNWRDIKGEFDPALGKGILYDVDTEYMDNECLTLVCPTNIIVELVRKNIDTIKEAIDKKLNKEFKVNAVLKSSFDEWHNSVYGKVDKAREDPEFESILSGYFPDMEYE